jgi:hypothetical protein
MGLYWGTIKWCQHDNSNHGEYAMCEITNEYRIIPNKINPKLGLVVPVNPLPNSRPTSFYKDPAERRKDHIANHRVGFKTNLCQMSPDTYFMKFTHLFHYLECALSVVVLEEANGNKSIVCDFPAIDGDVLNTFVNDDEFLFSSLIIHFHMNIMHQLLLFCEEHQASNLILNVDRNYYQELQSYEGIVSFPHPPNTTGKKVTMMIDPIKTPSHKWEKSMRISIEELQKELWAEKNNNAVVYEYIKLNPFHDLFC